MPSPLGALKYVPLFLKGLGRFDKLEFLSGTIHPGTINCFFKVFLCYIFVFIHTPSQQSCIIPIANIFAIFNLIEMSINIYFT